MPEPSKQFSIFCKMLPTHGIIGKTEAVTTYLRCFHRNLHQIQAIQADYFTVPQILNQFMRGLCSSILQHICPMHSQTLQDAVTNTWNFEFAKLKANHAQAINLVMNELSELNSKLKQFSTGYTQNPNAQHYLSLLVTPENILPNNQELNQTKSLISNILPATITNDKLLAAIFPFELEEPLQTLLFSRAALKEKPIMTMYIDVKVDSQFIKLILDSVDHAVSTRIITTNGATKMLIGEIDEFLFEINGLIMPIKVLVIKATQYQALISNDWLSKTNAVFDWTTQKLQLN
ncbi:hypothetical protein G9A89_011413 [Geosiphon pyriformis]|nr:hypothetical protein G9A89_011413 [Geosiphon pyriformis]